MGKTLEEYTEDVREFTRDIASHNRLLRFEEEFTDAEIERAINKALAKFNGIPPRIGEYTLATFPDDSLIVDMATCQILKMTGLQKTRNTLNYSDGGLTVADTEKVGLYMNWANSLCQMALAEAKELKMVLNAEEMLTNAKGIGSDYGRLEW